VSLGHGVAGVLEVVNGCVGCVVCSDLEFGSRGNGCRSIGTGLVVAAELNTQTEICLSIIVAIIVVEGQTIVTKGVDSAIEHIRTRSTTIITGVETINNQLLVSLFGVVSTGFVSARVEMEITYTVLGSRAALAAITSRVRIKAHSA
jgi:hypothetical protein